MKRKRLSASDLKVATIVFGLFVQQQLLLTHLVATTPSSSFHISNKIIHHQQPTQTSADSISYSSHFDRDQQEQPMAGRQPMAPELAENPQSSNDDAGSLESEHEEADNSHELPDRNVFMDQHNSQLQAMHNLFERRQLNNHQLQASQELSPISIGLDPISGAGSPFSMPPFNVPNHEHPAGHNKPPMANVDNLDQAMGPGLPFSLNPLPQLLGFQSPPFDGPQRGDQSAHANHHTAMSSTDSEIGQKVWPKIFRFTDGRINLSEFEKQKKIRLSSKNQHNENHIESVAPIMFDGRQLKRKSFLILHGGIFSR